MKTSIIAIALCFAASPSHAEIYRCDENGRVVYQAAPCAGSGSVLKVQQKKKPGHDLPEFMRATDAEMIEWRKNGAWKIAMDLKLVLVGMPEKLVYALLGMPDHTNTTNTEYGSRHQLVYRKPGLMRDSYIYVEGGKVVATQN